MFGPNFPYAVGQTGSTSAPQIGSYDKIYENPVRDPTRIRTVSHVAHPSKLPFTLLKSSHRPPKEESLDFTFLFQKLTSPEPLRLLIVSGRALWFPRSARQIPGGPCQKHTHFLSRFGPYVHSKVGILCA
ncbi:hypothetical protein DM860_001209 [Cuscuta australis]|uniref:Uncharacterized protein n=1 Tax=Cuscuta australis TaxID=267555 RepID=A0A328DWX7_9ASTE|nr:hypothetical protein DM860_001209 [Cuscuta australis]